eukprot:4160327-Pyramimonas_sp.AAC.1
MATATATATTTTTTAGGKLGERQAIKIVSKTMQMGPPWIMYDPLSESLRSLYIEIVGASDS